MREGNVVHPWQHGFGPGTRGCGRRRLTCRLRALLERAGRAVAGEERFQAEGAVVSWEELEGARAWDRAHAAHAATLQLRSQHCHLPCALARERARQMQGLPARLPAQLAPQLAHGTCGHPAPEKPVPVEHANAWHISHALTLQVCREVRGSWGIRASDCGGVRTSCSNARRPRRLLKQGGGRQRRR
jgi:hypothetical protein